MIDNWPPAKGPRPKHLAFKMDYLPVLPKTSEFVFKLPRPYREERRAMLMAIMEHQEGQKHKEKISRSGLPEEDGGELCGEAVRVGEKFALAHHVLTVSSLTAAQASRMIFGAAKDVPTISEMRPRPAKVKLTYPLSRGVQVEVRPFIPVLRGENRNVYRQRRMTVGYFLWQVAQVYRGIYVDWKRYGVWGHALEDLYFEAMKVKSGGWVDLQVGSR